MFTKKFKMTLLSYILTGVLPLTAMLPNSAFATGGGSDGHKCSDESAMLKESDIVSLVNDSTKFKNDYLIKLVDKLNSTLEKGSDLKDNKAQFIYSSMWLTSHYDGNKFIYPPSLKEDILATQFKVGDCDDQDADLCTTNKKFYSDIIFNVKKLNCITYNELTARLMHEFSRHYAGDENSIEGHPLTNAVRKLLGKGYLNEISFGESDSGFGKSYTYTAKEIEADGWVTYSDFKMIRDENILSVYPWVYITQNGHKISSLSIADSIFYEMKKKLTDRLCALINNKKITNSDFNLDLDQIIPSSIYFILQENRDNNSEYFSMERRGSDPYSDIHYIKDLKCKFN